MELDLRAKYCKYYLIIFASNRSIFLLTQDVPLVTCLNVMIVQIGLSAQNLSVLKDLISSHVMMKNTVSLPFSLVMGTLNVKMNQVSVFLYYSVFWF